MVVVNRYYKYEEFVKDVKNIGDKISDEVDTIVGISRGGLTFSHFLAEYLNIRKLFSISAISYNKKEKLENMNIFGVPNLKKSKKVLIVDDISDSGRTLKEVVAKLKMVYPDIEFETATIFYGKNSIFKPDFYVYKSDEWVEFFWSEDFKVLEKGKN